MVCSFVNTFVKKYGDSRSNGYFLASSIWMPIVIMILYVLFVTIIGPWFMKKREPYNIRKWVMAYDAMQILANGYIVIRIIIVLCTTERLALCIEFDLSDSADGITDLWLMYLYYLVKVTDALDTVFFVLKKSYRQVTFLHVYHHALMIFFGWIAMKFAPGGHNLYFGLSNCFVHTVMYSYYLLAAYDTRFRNSLNFKKLVTQLQLAQFVVLSILFLATLRNSCEYPRAITAVIVSQSFFFIYLFGKFYYNSYLKRDKKD